MYSLIESTKLNGVNPQHYLADVLAPIPGQAHRAPTMLSSPTEKLNEWVEKHSMSFDARGLLHATPKDADGRCWHSTDD